MKGSLMIRWLFLLASVIQCQSFVPLPPGSFAAGRVTSKSMANGEIPLSGGVDGDISIVSDSINITEFVNPDELLPLAPPLSFEKYITMQDKRVVVTIRYSGGSGLKPYYLTVAKYLKASHPDVLIEKRILPALESDAKEGPTFEVLVDGKVVVGKGKIQIQKLGSASAVDDATGGISIFVSMQEIDSVISKARRRRRPSTSYGDDPAKVDLDMLRKSSESNRLND